MHVRMDAIHVEFRPLYSVLLESVETNVLSLTNRVKMAYICGPCCMQVWEADQRGTLGAREEVGYRNV